MTHPIRTIRIPLPPLSDQAVVDLLDFLQRAIACFESRYADQIHRYYDELSEHNLRHPDPPPSSEGDPF